jgi:hypothetical protein
MQRDDFRADLPVTRTQWENIAKDALRVLGEQAPANRYEATVTLVQLAESAPAAPAPPVRLAS